MQRQMLSRLIALAIILALSLSLQVGAASIPQRADIEEQHTWNTATIFPDLDAWEAAFIQVKNGIGEFEKFEGKLGQSADMLLGCLKLSDSLNIILDNLYVYAYLRLDEDNRSSQFQELGGRVSALNTDVGEATSFIQPEILAIEGDKLQSYLKANPELDVFRFYLEDLQRSKEHILSAKEEAILSLASPVAGAPSEIFTMINDADITYGSIMDENGEEVELTKQRYYKYLESPDRRLRRDANQAYNKAYLKYENTLASTLASSVKRDYFYMKARGYNSCLEMSLDNYNIPTSVFHNLIDAVNANLAPLHKWTSIRKRILGYDTLFTYDLSAPLLENQNQDYSYEEAEKMILTGLQPLGKDYLSNLEMGLNGRWVDVFETQGKGSGAYSWGTYTSHPFVLMNYNNTLENVFTLAHEMGHAMHSHYTNKQEPYVYHNHSLFVAEVASTCNEATLMKYLLQNTEDKEEKKRLLLYYIDQIIGTFYTQVMFSEFELAIHEEIEGGGALSADFFRRTYRNIYQKYWGPELVIDSVNDLGGMRISHFYRQYYVYQYATCYAAAQMLSQQLVEKGDDFWPTYEQFISTGSSIYPVDILKRAGVDMTTPEPIDRTIKRFGELVDQMEKLLEES